jgi:hypothetical protein
MLPNETLLHIQWRRRRGAVTALTTETRTELAHRSFDGMDVTLVWVQGAGGEKAVVCVRDDCRADYFEIPTETYLALDVFYHPFAYRDFSTVGNEPGWVAA